MNEILNIFKKSAEIKIDFAEANVVLIEKVVGVIVHILQAGKKILIFGNGGSAADAQHIAAEFGAWRGLGRCWRLLSINREQWPGQAYPPIAHIALLASQKYTNNPAFLVFLNGSGSLRAFGPSATRFGSAYESKEYHKFLWWSADQYGQQTVPYSDMLRKQVWQKFLCGLGGEVFLSFHQVLEQSF